MSRAVSRPYDRRAVDGRLRPQRRGPVRTVSASRARIVIELAGQAFESDLPDRPVVVGRGEGTDLRLLDDDIGLTQCRIEALGDGRHVVRDLASGRPTRVNGLEVQQVSLADGDVVEVGTARITYRAAVETPAAGSDRAEPAPAAAPRGALREAPPRDPLADGAGRPPTPSRHVSHHDLKKAMLGLGAAAVVAIVVAAVLSSGGASDDAAAAERRLQSALDLYRGQDYVAAASLLEDLDRAGTPLTVREKAGRYLELARAALADAADDADRLSAHPLDVDTEHLDTRRELFVRRHGALLVSRFDDAMNKVEAAQSAWRQDQLEDARKAAERRLASQQWSEARRVWTGLRAKGTPGVRFDDEVESALQAIESRAGEDASKLLEAANAAAATSGPEAGIARVEARLPDFEGTAAHGRLVGAVQDWQREIRDRLAAGHVPDVSGPTTAPGPTAPTPAPAPATDARVAEVEKARADAEKRARDRAYAAAAEALAAALRPDDAGPAVDRARARQADLVLAGRGLGLLIADISARPEAYRHVEMGAQVVVSLEAADAEGVTGSVTGGRARYRWSALPTTRLVGLVLEVKGHGEDLVALAGLLHELGAEAPADQRLVEAGSEGVPTATIFPLVARWRQEPVPEGGYVAWKGRYVSPAERDRLARLEQLDGLASKAHQADAKVWKPAAEELLSLGDDGRARLADVLTTRRGALVESIAASKAFDSGKTRAKLYDELQKRRAYALLLIEDANAWPYPNPSGQNTDEVVRRVDAVREVWEHPFSLVASWNASLKSRLAEVADLDAFLVRADPSYKPDLADLDQRVGKRIDMPSYTPDAGSAGLRQYSLKVLAFNERVATTSTREEKDCVRAVNEYRMMMGRRAVRINERLVRAARGHSIDMRVNGYFAHDTPAPYATPDSRTPGDRVRKQGYGGGVGENIAMGTWSGRDAFAAWFHSSGHHRNMVAAGWTEMGAGRSGGSWWTQNFGAAGGTSLKEPDELPPPEKAFAPEPEDDSGRPLDRGGERLPNEPPPGSPPPAAPPDEPGAPSD